MQTHHPVCCRSRKRGSDHDRPLVRQGRSLYRSSRRQGGSMVDLLVACLLIMSMLGTLSLMTGRSHRLMSEAREQQVALDELSNQLDALLAVEPDQIDTALLSVVVSQESLQTLPNAKVDIRRLADEHGDRLVASLDWQRRVPGTPVTLVAWLDSAPKESP